MTLVAGATPITFVLTADRDRAKAFYRDVVGLPVQAEDDFAITFGLGGGVSMRLTGQPGYNAQDHTVLGWAVSDIRKAMAELRDRGAVFRIYDGFGQDEDGVWDAPGGGARVAWFTDPDGNVLSLTEFAN